MLLINRSVWNVGNNEKEGSWKQATVGLMLFRCDYAETTIIIIIIKFVQNIFLQKIRLLENALKYAESLRISEKF